MTPETYVELAGKTASDERPVGWDDVSTVSLMDTLQFVSEFSTELDQYKKKIFYGKSLPFPYEVARNCRSLTELWGDDQKRWAIFHGIIGAATEAGEMVESLLSSMETQTPIDEVNLKEEIGDLFWYIAEITRALGWSFEEIMDLNISKLKRRYGEKFSTEAAINRDVKAERELLENGA